MKRKIPVLYFKRADGWCESAVKGYVILASKQHGRKLRQVVCDGATVIWIPDDCPGMRQLAAN
jgi:hypothetical protein